MVIAMSRKNKGFGADLAAGIDIPAAAPPRPARSLGILDGRENRLAALASGKTIARTYELVDPARCRMWENHNRDYAALSEERCVDLIESIKAQGKQEMPAIVRRVKDSPDYDFEVICGARRHWSVSWLRANNYPEFQFLVDIRELTDEEAFRISDIENRAREDISDLERARDYLGALEAYYGGKQKSMAERLNVSESWLSRYLDLARLPDALLLVFPDPLDLRIKHIGSLKPLLKPDDRRTRTLVEAQALRAELAEGQGDSPSVPEIIRQLTRRVDAPKKTGSPKKTGLVAQTVKDAAEKPLFRIDKRAAKAVTLTLLPAGGGSSDEAEAAIVALVRDLWASSAKA